MFPINSSGQFSEGRAFAEHRALMAQQLEREIQGRLSQQQQIAPIAPTSTDVFNDWLRRHAPHATESEKAELRRKWDEIEAALRLEEQARNAERLRADFERLDGVNRIELILMKLQSAGIPAREESQTIAERTIKSGLRRRKLAAITRSAPPHYPLGPGSPNPPEYGITLDAKLLILRRYGHFQPEVRTFFEHYDGNQLEPRQWAMALDAYARSVGVRIGEWSEPDGWARWSKGQREGRHRPGWSPPPK